MAAMTTLTTIMQNSTSKWMVKSFMNLFKICKKWQICQKYEKCNFLYKLILRKKKDTIFKAFCHQKLIKTTLFMLNSNFSSREHSFWSFSFNFSFKEFSSNNTALLMRLTTRKRWSRSILILSGLPKSKLHLHVHDKSQI